LHQIPQWAALQSGKPSLQRLCGFHKRKSVIIAGCAHSICTALWIWTPKSHRVERSWRGPKSATGPFLILLRLRRPRPRRAAAGISRNTKSTGDPASAMSVRHRRLSRRTVRQARSARETHEASTAGCGLLQSRTILIENGPAAAGDAARKGRLKIASGVRGLMVYCSDYRCSHYIAISGDRWPDDVRLSDIEPRFTCNVCEQRGADVRPNFHWEEEARRTKVPAAADHAMPSP